MAIKISISNQKGGVGKTTTAIELAAALKAKGYDVLAIDLDQQANLTRYTGLSTKGLGIYDVLKDKEGTLNIKDIIRSADEFDVLTASDSLSSADKEFGAALDIMRLKKALKSINDDYDFIIIDNNPARNVLLNMTYIASDYIIIPAEAEEGSILGIKAIFKDLNDYKKEEWSDAEILGVILTKYERTGMHGYGEEQIKEFLDEEIPDAFLIKVRKSIVASECKSERISMQKGKASSKPAKDYKDVVEEIIKRVV